MVKCKIQWIWANTNLPTFNINHITQNKVQVLMNSFNPSPAKDIHGMDSAMLKYLKESLAPPIMQIINLSISQGVFPNSWKTSVISPIFRSGDPQSVCNYKPISILPVVSKVAEKWVAKQLISHLNNSHFSLHPMQFGFRAHHSTETANCFFLEQLKLMMDKGGTVGAVFLDLQKAFDTVNHKVLIAKLSTFNFSHNALKWTESYLNNRTQCVKVNHHQSAALETVSYKLTCFTRCLVRTISCPQRGGTWQ